MKKMKLLLLTMLCLPSMVFANTKTNCIDENDEFISGERFNCITGLYSYTKGYYDSSSLINLFDESVFDVKYYQAEYDEDGNIVYSLYEPTDENSYISAGARDNYFKYIYGNNTYLPKVNGKKAKWTLKEIKKEGYGSTSSYRDISGIEHNSSYEYTYYTDQYVVFYQIPIKEVKPSIKCDALEMQIDEKVNCQVTLNKDVVYSSVSFKLTSSKLKFENIKLATNWSKEEIENGYLIKYDNTDNLLGNSENIENVVTFDVKYVDELKNKTNEYIEINNFSYINELGDNEVNSNITKSDKTYYAFKLDNVKKIKPIPVNGKLSLWDYDYKNN